MSKCDVVIEFDRPDRRYRGGEEVSGTATITVRQDVECKGVMLARGWRTHGRGNPDRGDVISEPLAGGCMLSAGQTIQCPFSFAAPREPLTYHGQYLSVDHYVKVSVDVPWAIDPKGEEDLIVLAGAAPDDAPFKRDKIRKPDDKSKKQAGIAGKIVLIVFAPLLLILVLMVLPFAALFLIIRFVYRMIVSSRVGKVTLKTPHVVVASGEAWPLELSFTPRRNLVLNGIAVRFTAQERCVSGSGTKKTTHRNKLVDEQVWIREQGEVTAGRPLAIQTEVELPVTESVSFEASDNHLEWKAEVRIDIPKFPDWKQSVELQMVPTEFVEPVRSTGRRHARTPAPRAVESAMPTARAWPAPAGGTNEVPAAEARVEPTPVETTASTVRQAATSAVSGGGALADVLTSLSSADLFGSQREAAIAERSDQSFQCGVVIQQMLSTYGGHEDHRLVNGRTIVGTLVGAGRQVQVLTDAAHNDGNDELDGGDTWTGTVRIAAWDDLYDRAILHEA